MTGLAIGLTSLAVVIVVVLVAVFVRSQRDATDRLNRQVTDVLDRVHRALSEFGQQVQGGQTSTGEALQKGLEEARRTLQAQLEGLVGTVNKQLARSQELSGQQLEGATKVFGELRGQLGQVAEMATRMEALGREIDELQGILKAPKLRGNLGEASLEEFFRQVLLPGFWEMQHRFRDGQTVDAVIKLRDRLVPVDAKFPLESFQRLLAAEDDAARKAARKEFERSVKGRIDEIADKYIRPGEGTFEFALMFIPAENIYYEVIIKDESLGEGGSLLAYANSRRVVPVSPNSFYAYLSTIVTGLKGMQVEAQAREIQARVAQLQTDFGRLAEVFRLVGTHIANAQKKYEEAERLTGKFEDSLQAVTERELEAPLPGGENPPLPPET
jgi:DNA recombination protein RmuC